ncbi:MAG: ATP-binding protein [Limisphaerales bacterium]
MVNQLSDKAQFRCRFHIQRLPRNIQVSSQTRHNISLAVKEAVHNVIKHAKASEVIVRITFEAKLLTISIQDDGCGFQVADNQDGNGLTNMRQRLEV